jgi:hypothetical protein
VRNADISVSANDPVPEGSLVSEIARRVPLFAALKCGKMTTRDVYGAVLERFSNLIGNMRALRVTSYELNDGVHNRSRAFDSACFFDRAENTLYVTGQWTDPSVMHMLAKEIGRFLGIPDMAHDIHLLLQIDESKGSTWLSNEGYEIELTFSDTSEEGNQPEDATNIVDIETGEESQQGTIPDPASIGPPTHKRCTADNYSPTHDSGAAFCEQLVTLLDAQESPYKGHIYHYTHVENIPNILNECKIAARATLNSFLDSAGPGLIAQTSDAVKQFARFYFRPLTPTQWHNEGLGRSVNGIRAFCPVPIFLRIPIRSALEAGGNRCAVSNGNMASSYSHFGNSVEFLKFFDQQNVYALFGTAPLATYMASSQQEFLVQDALDLTRCRVELVCRDEQDRQTLEAVLKDTSKTTIDYQVEVDPSYFHGDAPRLRVMSHSLEEIHFGLIGCRRSVEGVFSLELAGGNSSTDFESQGLRLASDQDISISGTLSGKMRIHYTENDETRLVYAATLPSCH